MLGCQLHEHAERGPRVSTVSGGETFEVPSHNLPFLYLLFQGFLSMLQYVVLLSPIL